MRKKIEFNVEELGSGIYRIKVIGGWLVLHQTTEKSGKACSESMAFVADRDHEWYILPPIQEAEAAKPTVKADDFAPNK